MCTLSPSLPPSPIYTPFTHIFNTPINPLHTKKTSPSKRKPLPATPILKHAPNRRFLPDYSPPTSPPHHSQTNAAASSLPYPRKPHAPVSFPCAYLLASNPSWRRGRRNATCGAIGELLERSAGPSHHITPTQTHLLASPPFHNSTSSHHSTPSASHPYPTNSSKSPPQDLIPSHLHFTQG